MRLNVAKISSHIFAVTLDTASDYRRLSAAICLLLLTSSHEVE